MKGVFIIACDKVVGSSYMDVVHSPDRIRFNGRRARPAHCFLFVLFPPDQICSHIFCISSFAMYFDLHFKSCNMYLYFLLHRSLWRFLFVLFPQNKGY